MPFKIYTKTGDAGETSLFGGKRVSKTDMRVDAYGTVDELNAFVGALRDHVTEHPQDAVLEAIQNRLFSLGAYLAADPDKPSMPMDLNEGDIDLLEKNMDEMDETLPELRNFILPGGHPAVSAAHVCRTVCRRAERVVINLHRNQSLAPLALQYLNRLSDYFFILARKIGQDFNAKEIVWKQRG